MEFRLQGPLTDAASAWALVGDTDLLNRIAQSPAVEMQIAPDAHAYPEVRGTLIGPSVLRHHFVEVDSRWVHHRWYRQERLVSGPVLQRMRYHGWLEPADGGVIPHIHFRADFRNPLVSLVGWPNMQSAERSWGQALSRLPPPDAPIEPRVLRPLPRVVDRGLEAWRQRCGDTVVDHFRTHLTTARTPDLTRLRPFALADGWGLDRDHVLMSFLEGTRVGAVELVWMSRCPRCFAGVSTAASLSDLADHAECVSCRIGFSPTLDEDVEVVFAAHPSMRPTERERFCSLYPADRPEVRMLLTLAPQSEETVEVPIPHGQWRLGAGGDRPDQILHVEGSGSASHRWFPGASETVSIQPGTLSLTLQNPTDGRLRVQLAGTPDSRAFVSAARLASYPGYSKLFGPQALSPDVRLSVTGVAILFTDLSGSTAIYETHGDATAFSVVHAHFALLREAIEQNGGTQVKTIGDAVMASFSDPLQAIRAGLAMQKAFQQWADSLQLEYPPGLRVGIHFGPALVVHTDQAGLDYFGGTVNLAARTEGQARPGEVVWTRALHDSAGVADALEADRLAMETFTTTVKGIEQPVELVRCRP